MRNLRLASALLCALALSTSALAHDHDDDARGDDDGQACTPAPIVAPDCYFSPNALTALVQSAAAQAATQAVAAALVHIDLPRGVYVIDGVSAAAPCAAAPVRFRVFKQRRNGRLLPTKLVIEADSE